MTLLEARDERGTGFLRHFCATLHHANETTLSTVVCASRIEALCSMKLEMVKCGVPESKIGLIYTAPKTVRYSEPATTNNEGRQFLLISHQRVGNESHLEQFNTYYEQPRSLVVYDESLLVSDISHFNVLDLCQSLAGWIARYRLDPDQARVDQHF